MTTVAVLASGSGTILESILGHGLPVALVLTDRPCRALEVASAQGVAVQMVDRKRWGGFGPGFDRAGYSSAVAEALRRSGVGLVAMAGYGTVLGKAVHEAFPGRVLNTHPALLPAFPGWHAVEDALAAGVTETGCTVHVAALEADSGPILAQRRVPVHPGDTVATLHERIKRAERSLYPAAIAAVLEALAAGRRPADVDPAMLAGAVQRAPAGRA